MSHTIYNTEAFVISSRNSGEADRVFMLFTKDFGVVSAKATGIRKVESRLRFFVQDFKYIDASIVKGKNYWRLVSARPIHELNSRKSLGTSSRIRSLQLVGKLAPGEEPIPGLFDELVSAYNFTSNFHPKNDELESIEALLALKILHVLGYWGDKQSDGDFVTSTFNEETLQKIKDSKKMIIKELNNSLRATQLL
jgi:DNA repair protein RecO (recombination protein O)